MTEVLTIGLSIAAAWNIIGFIVLLLIPYSRDASDFKEMFSPKSIYENAEVNWFGCIVLTIFFNLLCPVLSGIYWFYWLCTVGRNKE